MGLIANVEKEKRKRAVVQTFSIPQEEKLLSFTEEKLLDYKGNIQKKRKIQTQDYRYIEVEEAIHSTERDIGRLGHEHSIRVPTGIEGLDEVMEGGLRKGTVNLVGGGAGCGKSILSMQYLVEGIRKYNESGMYISFEESPEKIIKDFSSFGWDLKGYVENKKLVILYYTPEQVERFLESGGGIVRDLVETLGVKRMVVDSLTAFSLLFPTELEKTKGILKLFDSIHEWGVTSMMTSEQEPDSMHHKSTVIEFQVDGVVLLYNIRKGDIRERSLEIFKMRATKHSAKIFPMQITDFGVTIYPEEPVF